MRTEAIAILWLMATCVWAQQPAKWEFPNFPDRVDFAVQNTAGDPINDVIALKVADLRKIAPGFPGTLAVAATDEVPAHFLETERDAREFSVAVTLAPHERETVSIYYSSSLHDSIPAIKRVYASHNYGYNHATAAIESDLIGYRTYGGFFFDVQAHRKGQLGLFNSLLGYSSISRPPVEGEDVIHLGDTLGLGGLFLRTGKSVYRPPFNTPDYAHRPSRPGEPVYKIVSAGPLRAIIEASLPDWKIGDDHVALHALYEMDADSEVIHCKWWITPLHLSKTYEIGAGIRDLPDKKILESPGVVVTSGVQSKKVGRVALGLWFPTGEARRAGTLMTPDGGNQVVVFLAKLRAGATVAGSYSFAAAWSGSGWTDTAAHVRDLLQEDSVRPRISSFQHIGNPDVQRLDREPR